MNEDNGEVDRDGVAGSPVIPIEVAPPSSCQQCGEVVAGDYKSRRAHVYANHPPGKKPTILETQEVLKGAMGGCFHNAVVQNDLMVPSLQCNYRGCGQGVGHYKGKVVAEVQRPHIQQKHLASTAGDLNPPEKKSTKLVRSRRGRGGDGTRLT